MTIKGDGMLQLEFLFTLSADVGELISLGPCPLGERRVVYITSGTFEGPAMRGELVGGADWQILRNDGALELDARYAIREARGGVVQVVSQGYRHGPPEVMARLARDETVDPALYYFRTFMRFETADPASSWLNRILAIGYGARQKGAVRIEVFEVL
jgi:Protein of unknown function (DUF3237)